MSNRESTIVKRMSAAGFPYEITGMETPMFAFSGGTQAVAIWRNSQDDTERAFVGFYDYLGAKDACIKGCKVRGVHSTYVVEVERIGE